jgi:uncharacterized protein (TIGR00730 family)
MNNSTSAAPTLANSSASTSLADYHLLEGPHSRTSELMLLFRVFRDYLRGMRSLHFVGPCVSVFGSARVAESSAHYDLARRMGGEIARLGFTVLTGGGPGIMEAANRGAHEVGGRSVGCNIRLPHEQKPNAYVDRSVTLDFFSVRKTLLIKYSYAFVVMPGGFGTVDECFEALTLIQTGKLKNFPIIVMDTGYWADMISLLTKMLDTGMISPPDLKLIYATNSVDEAIDYIRLKAIEPFGLVPVVRRHFPWLLERGYHRARLMAARQFDSMKARLDRPAAKP